MSGDWEDSNYEMSKEDILYGRLEEALLEKTRYGVILRQADAAVKSHEQGSKVRIDRPASAYDHRFELLPMAIDDVCRLLKAKAERAAADAYEANVASIEFENELSGARDEIKALKAELRELKKSKKKG